MLFRLPICNRCAISAIVSVVKGVVKLKGSYHSVIQRLKADQSARPVQGGDSASICCIQGFSGRRGQTILLHALVPAVGVFKGVIYGIVIFFSPLSCASRQFYVFAAMFLPLPFQMAEFMHLLTRQQKTKSSYMLPPVAAVLPAEKSN